MTQTFTPSFVQNLQSNLYAKAEPESATINQTSTKENYYFQLLVFEGSTHTPKLFYGTKKDLEGYFNLKDDFPATGVKIEPHFLPKPSENEDNSMTTVEQTSIVHWLLQTRKLSQMIAYSWLNPENIEDDETRSKAKLVKNIFDYPTTQPDVYSVKKDLDSPDGYIVESCETLDDLPKQLPNIKLFSNNSNDTSSLLISPTHMSYKYICLALLLCGQAFFNKNGSNQDQDYTRIWEPIADIRQLIMELGISVTWDTFYGAITDISDLGQKSQSPYRQATIPYPPRPGEFNLSQQQIKDWAMAEDEGGDYPFYPDKDEVTDSGSWRTKFVNPPSPYIPLSCI